MGEPLNKTSNQRKKTFLNAGKKRKLKRGKEKRRGSFEPCDKQKPIGFSEARQCSQKKRNAIHEREKHPQPKEKRAEGRKQKIVSVTTAS